ncbi:MAG: hypothetical protein SVY10_04680 [Thermodesulfobacteriota bacterium]|nr:hypothetical protein [Thermodesulfobacteriota bacterium]
MGELSSEDEKRKKAIFDGMSAKRQKKIQEKGYDNWDPFVLPKDPIDIRTDQNRHSAVALTGKFLQTCSHEEYSRVYGQGVWEICIGIISGNERYRAMYEFSCWYKDFLKEGEL